MQIISASNQLKFDIQLDQRLAGYTMSSCKPGSYAWICQREFVSSEDGNIFISRLEGLPSLFLNKIRQLHGVYIIQSVIDNMLALLRKDNSATIYINTPMRALMQGKKWMNQGECVSRNDIADVRELVFCDVEIPPEVSVMALFSVGWRKGLYYDLSSLHDDDPNRDYNLNLLLGGYYAYLLFQERFQISDSQWDSLLQNGWFPFITLSDDLIGNILGHNKENWDIDELLPRLHEYILKILPVSLDKWEKITVYEPHMEFIKQSVKHYKENEFISCISVLFPRIEGILRQFQYIHGQPEKSKQVDLAATVLSPTVNPKNQKFSPLFPIRFNQYLNQVYFANFDPRQTSHSLSRNTVGHGVATPENFNLKGSTIGFLILDQLSYYFAGIN